MDGTFAEHMVNCFIVAAIALLTRILSKPKLSNSPLILELQNNAERQRKNNDWKDQDSQ